MRHRVILLMLVIGGMLALLLVSRVQPVAPSHAATPESTPASVLTDIHTIDDLKDRFNQDTGVPRLILLLSPT